VTLTLAYPAHLESDVVLRTGRTLRIRPVRPEDCEGLRALFAGLSKRSLYTRFLDVRSPEEALRYAPADVDYVHDFGVVGEIGGEIVAVAHYFASTKRPKVAEVAFTICDALQNCGVATRLLEKLAQVARTNGIERFEAEMLGDNHAMLDVFLGMGFELTSRAEAGAVHVSFAIAPTPASEEAAAMRSRKAAHASMQAVFEPRSIAVVGASRRKGQLGTEVLRNLRDTGFTGALFAVNPSADEIEGVRCFPTLAAIPQPVELAVIAVPADRVEAVVDDCVDKNVRAIVVITAGFGETGDEGRIREQRLVDKVRAAGMRMVGPNCMGVLNTDPSVKMHATFSSIFPPPGNVAMSSQSGALGLAILDYARSLNIGFSTFVSVGNKADVSGNDLIQYWAEDPHTDVMLLYLESFGNPRRFGEIARRVARKKPIVAVKAGRSRAGAKAAASHTGALATSDAIVGDLFRQAGIIRTDTLEELFDVAALLANQPLPAGHRVAIVTNAGGPAILAADACEANGLALATLSDATTNALRSFLPAAASVGNPVDMIASATPDQYRRALDLLLGDENVDAVIAIYIPVLPTDAPQVASAIRDSATRTGGKTLLATFMSSEGLPEPLAPVPSFPFPERAAAALARATNYAEWRRRPPGVVTEFADVDRVALRAIVDDKVASGGGWLDANDVSRFLRAAGITVASTTVVANADEAVGAANAVGYPVVLKVEGPLHKSDVGGVRLNIHDDASLRDAFADFRARLGDTMTGAVVQPMVGGVEVMLGVTLDPIFGHVMVFGAGGTMVELMADVSFRLHPLTDRDTGEMIDEVRWSKLLRGFRGVPPSDIDAVRAALLRLSAAISICPEVRELDINPLKAMQHGATVIDARIRVEEIVPAPPSRRISY
jgi:acetyl coenzyme A synthetase (ADP forming)-like protein